MKHIRVAAQIDLLPVSLARQLLRFRLILRNEDCPIRPVPSRDLVPLPELPGYAPGLNLAHPVKKGVLPLAWHKTRAPLFDRDQRRSGEDTRVAIPLVGRL